MTTITIEDAQAKLAEIIGGLARGEELIITQEDRVVARLVGERTEPRGRLAPGFAKGMMEIVSDDDEHLKGFGESMIGGSSVVFRSDEPLTPSPTSELPPRKAGSAKDKILWISPDFDDPLEEFREYME